MHITLPPEVQKMPPNVKEAAGTGGDEVAGEDRRMAKTDIIVERLLAATYNYDTWDMLRNAPIWMKGDREIVLAAVKRGGHALKFATKELKNDKGIVREAVKHNGLAIGYASETLQADREIVLEAAKQNGNTLMFASNTLRADREIVREAVKQDGYALQHASKPLRAERKRDCP